jgi:hypothetical protein
MCGEWPGYTEDDFHSRVYVNICDTLHDPLTYLHGEMVPIPQVLRPAITGRAPVEVELCRLERAWQSAATRRHVATRQVNLHWKMRGLQWLYN